MPDYTAIAHAAYKLATDEAAKGGSNDANTVASIAAGAGTGAGVGGAVGGPVGAVVGGVIGFIIGAIFGPSEPPAWVSDGRLGDLTQAIIASYGGDITSDLWNVQDDIRNDTPQRAAFFAWVKANMDRAATITASAQIDEGGVVRSVFRRVVPAAVEQAAEELAWIVEMVDFARNADLWINGIPWPVVWQSGPRGEVLGDIGDPDVYNIFVDVAGELYAANLPAYSHFRGKFPAAAAVASIALPIKAARPAATATAHLVAPRVTVKSAPAPKRSTARTVAIVGGAAALTAGALYGAWVKGWLAL